MSAIEAIKELLNRHFTKLSRPANDPIVVSREEAAQRFTDGITRNKSTHETILNECLKALPERASDIKLWTESPVEAKKAGIDLNELLDAISKNSNDVIADEFNCLLMAQYEIELYGEQPVRFFDEDSTELANKNVGAVEYDQLDR